MGTLSHIMKLDCQLIVGLGGNGLADLKPDGSDLWSAANWRHWPGALGVQDQGSKGVSANQALVYKPEIALNLLTLYDFSHGACRDLDLQYSEQGYMALVVLSLVVVNLRSGPEQEPGMRHEQLVDAVDYLFRVFSARNCVLFQARLLGMLNEIHKSLGRRPGEDMDECAFRYLKERAPTQCKGDKIKLCQFMGWIIAMHDFLLRWEQERFMREWLALENDYLPIAALKHTIAVSKEVIEHGKALTTTSSRVTQVDTKLLRQSSVNNIVLSVKFQEHFAHKRIVSTLVHVAWPLRLWQGEAAKEMNSVEENLRWLLRHANVDFLAHQHAILLGLTDPEKMMKCGFLMPQSRIDMTTWEAELAAEDQFAEMCGTLALGLVAKRHKRLFYLTSAWPSQSIKMMLGLEHAQATRKQFLVEMTLHEYIIAYFVQSE